MTIRKSATLEVLDGKPGGPWDVLISTNRLDRDKDTIDPLGWRVNDYLKNPVVMWSHDYIGMTPAGGVPVGATQKLVLDQQGPIATFNFRQPANDYDFVNVVRSAWEQEILRAASVGFSPIEFKENERGGRDFLAQDLLEWSITAVPSNADALRRSYELALKAAGMDALLSAPEATSKHVFDMKPATVEFAIKQDKNTPEAVADAPTEAESVDEPGELDNADVTAQDTDGEPAEHAADAEEQESQRQTPEAAAATVAADADDGLTPEQEAALTDMLEEMLQSVIDYLRETTE